MRCCAREGRSLKEMGIEAEEGKPPALAVPAAEGLGVDIALVD